MMHLSEELKQHTYNPEKARICGKFLNTNQPRYLFGKNAYAEKVLQHIDVEGIIDDFSAETEYMGKPILRMENIPQNAMVLALSGGKPLSAEKRLRDAGFQHLDYFAFFKYSGLPLDEIRFAEGFSEDYAKYKAKYDWLKNKLADDTSVHQLQKLVNFKLSYELEYLDGFRDLEHLQYFEPFLGLSSAGESFADVGSFDGYTSEAFIRHCPDYRTIHVFEPVPANMEMVKAKLSHCRDLQYHPYGLSDQRQTLYFENNGSCSTVSECGTVPIMVERLDDVLEDPLTFIKMDIEGGELDAIDGASETIRRNNPVLAVSVYHRPSDLWTIPEKILSLNEEYLIFIRHYTESVYETVMFFVPKDRIKD